LRPHEKPLDPVKPITKTLDFKIIAIQNFGDNPEPAIWEIISQHYNEESDIAILRLECLNQVAKKIYLVKLTNNETDGSKT
jgi:hypothetical protein